jgi:hypothetical protein
LLRPSGGFLRYTSHEHAEVAFIGIAQPLADDSAATHDKNAIGKGTDFVKLNGNQENGLAHVAEFNQSAVNEFDSANINTTRGLSNDQQRRIALDFARQYDLLLIAA